jgi:hypothetical protein
VEDYYKNLSGDLIPCLNFKRNKMLLEGEVALMEEEPQKYGVQQRYVDEKPRLEERQMDKPDPPILSKEKLLVEMKSESVTTGAANGPGRPVARKESGRWQPWERNDRR